MLGKSKQTNSITSSGAAGAAGPTFVAIPYIPKATGLTRSAGPCLQRWLLAKDPRNRTEKLLEWIADLEQQLRVADASADDIEDDLEDVISDKRLLERRVCGLEVRTWHSLVHALHRYSSRCLCSSNSFGNLPLLSGLWMESCHAKPWTSLMAYEGGKD